MELASQDILMLLRSSSGCTWRSVSKDKGKTWSQARLPPRASLKEDKGVTCRERLVEATGSSSRGESELDWGMWSARGPLVFSEGVHGIAPALQDMQRGESV